MASTLWLGDMMLREHVGWDIEEAPIRQTGRDRLKRGIFCDLLVGKSPQDSVRC